MSYEFYKVLHVMANMFLFVALGGVTLHAVNGGTRATNAGRKLASITHGVALLLIFVAGFGLMVKLGVGHGAGWPLWIWGKLALWLVLGGVVALIGRKPELGRTLWFLIPLLGGTAAWLAVYKPT